MSNPITQKQVIEIRRLHRTGLIQIEIARKMNLSRKTVAKVIASPIKFKNKVITQDNKIKVWELRAQFKPIKEIAEILGISEFTVGRVAREKFPNIVIKKSGKVTKYRIYYTESDTKNVLERAELPTTLMEIARVTEIPYNVVRNILKENNVKLTKPIKEPKNRITKYTGEKWKKTVKAGKVIDTDRVKQLYEVEGISKSAISRRLGISFDKVTDAVIGLNPPKLKNKKKRQLFERIKINHKTWIEVYSAEEAAKVREKYNI